MRILDIKNTKKEDLILEAVNVLKNGGLVIYPTETCYGVAVSATNLEAVNKLLEYKGNRRGKPISVAVNGKEMAKKYVVINDTAENIYNHFLPGPITVVSKSLGKVADVLESAEKNLGIRVPNYPLILELIEKFGSPITSTSANASDKKTPYTISDILDNLTESQKKLIDLVLDAGTLPPRQPSVIVDTTLENIKIIRPGDIDLLDYKFLVSKSEEETAKFSEKLLLELEPYLGSRKIIISLIGEMGAGKTYFTKFLGKNLGIKKEIVSPTFAICQEYNFFSKNKNLKLFHLDTHRLYEASELNFLKPENIFVEPNLVVIEWANKVEEYLQEYLKNSVYLKIYIDSISENERRFMYKIEFK